jgi:murein L,D-transpeptidase YafK
MKFTKKTVIRMIVYGVMLCGILLSYFFRQNILRYITSGHFQKYSVNQVLKKHEKKVRNRLEPIMNNKGLTWPPQKMFLLAFKAEKALELWLANENGSYQLIKSYLITKSSGQLGPKLYEGDRQVPEGIYDLVGLNPNSKFYLSIKVGYPNSLDICHSTVPLAKMGGDIFIHGGSLTIGCIPVGEDENIEELFCLAARILPVFRKILISPVDFRKKQWSYDNQEPWVQSMYEKLKKVLAEFPL